MTTLRPYPEYRTSGIPWIDDIPQHWAVKRNAYVMRELDRRSVSGNEVLLSVSQYSGVTLRANGHDPDVLISRAASLEGYKVVEPDDLVINIMLAWNGSLGFSRWNGIVSPAYCVYRLASGCYPRFFHHFLRHPAYLANIKVESTGVVDSRLRLYSDALFRLRSILPPLDEQRAIADFLDVMDEKITRFIAARRRMIALLEEQKGAIINQAVTRGLDPDVPLKPSGIDWLGDIPAHWEVRRLKQVAYLHRGYDLPEQSRQPGPYPVVSSGGIIGKHAAFKIRGPGVVAGRYGSTAALFYLEEDFWPHNTSLYVADFCGNDPRFIFLLLGTLAKEAHSGKSAVPGVDRKDLHEIKVALPSLRDQRTIVKYVDSLKRRVGQTISRHQHEIELMQEYRTRLISDVVTGKLDVRGVKPAESLNGKYYE